MDKSQIIKELRSYLGYKKDTELAEFLGIKQNTISSWKKDRSIDYELIISKCDNINANWLITGKGNMLLESKSPYIEERIERLENKLIGFNSEETDIFPIIENLLARVHQLEKDILILTNNKSKPSGR